NAEIFAGKSVHWEWYSVKTNKHYDLFDTPFVNQDGSISKFEIFHDITERVRAEEALRESEATARALLNAPTDVAAMIDPRGIILDTNETMAKRFDRPVNELVGMCVWDLFPLNIVESRKGYIHQVVESGEPARFEDERQGTWNDNIVYPVRNAQGRVTKVAILARDITGRKRAEKSIQYRLELEKLSNEVSISFINVGGAGIDDAINSALEKIARFANANRSSLFILSDDLETLTNTHEWCTSPEDSQIALLQNISFSSFGWHREELLQHKTIAISKPEDYPPEAKDEREWVKEHGFRSLLFIPLLKHGRLHGSIGFYGQTGKEIAWPFEFADMLKTVGNIVLNVRERQRAEAALR
ncbi:MAG: PAS domain-containing protein, partial [Proteobacteria bacterium]|nr:PAS domain-containing protein [Pseudomonadota bacterium]